MPQPTLTELRTAQAIIRQMRQKEEFRDKPHKGFIEAAKLAEKNFSDKILAIVESQPASNRETYLADGVYASHDETYIWLRADRDGMSHRIAIDQDVWFALLSYVNSERK